MSKRKVQWMCEFEKKKYLQNKIFIGWSECNGSLQLFLYFLFFYSESIVVGGKIILGSRDYLSFFNYVGVITWSVLPGLTTCKKFWSSICSMKLSVFLRLCLRSLPSNFAWNNVIICGLSLPHCYLDRLDKLQNRCVGLLVVRRWYYVPQRENVVNLTLFCWCKWKVFIWTCLFGFFFLLSSAVYMFIIYCMVFLSPFLHVRRISMSAISFLVQLNSGIFCF